MAVIAKTNSVAVMLTIMGDNRLTLSRLKKATLKVTLFGDVSKTKISN